MNMRLDSLEACVAIQTLPGNYDANPYMLGMANGMILALAMIKNEEPKFLNAPDVWLNDKPRDNISPTFEG